MDDFTPFNKTDGNNTIDFLSTPESGSGESDQSPDKFVGGPSGENANTTPVPIKDISPALAVAQSQSDEQKLIAARQLLETEQTDRRESNSNSIKRLVESEAWQNLSPNFPTSEALLPRDITASQLEAIIEAAFDPEMIASLAREEHGEEIFESKHIEGVGDLEKIGHGEAKVCFLLTTPDNRKMIVLLRGYDKSLGIQIPQDPKMSKISEGLGKNEWEYSDLRTYLLAPIDDTSPYGIKLQEFGGTDTARDDLSAIRNPVAFVNSQKAKRDALSYIKSSSLGDFQISNNTTRELSHPRHFLFNRGVLKPPALIDIPFQEIKH